MHQIQFSSVDREEAVQCTSLQNVYILTAFPFLVHYSLYRLGAALIFVPHFHLTALITVFRELIPTTMQHPQRRRSNANSSGQPPQLPHTTPPVNNRYTIQTWSCTCFHTTVSCHSTLFCFQTAHPVLIPTTLQHPHKATLQRSLGRMYWHRS